MRTLFVLICSLALVCAAGGEKGQKQAATETKTSHHAETHNQHPSSNSGHVEHAATHNEPSGSNSGPVQNVQAPHNVNVVVPTGNAARASAGTHTAPIGQPDHPQPQGGRPQTAPAGNTAAKTAASAPPAPVYHYNFPAKSGLIGRDFTRPLTPEEQSSIAREIANGQPEGNKAAPGGYQNDNGVYHYNFPAKSGLIGRDFTRPLTPEEQSSIAREIANGQPTGNQAAPVAINMTTVFTITTFRPNLVSLDVILRGR